MTVIATTDLLEVAERLRTGSVFYAEQISWGEYEELLAELGPAYGVRIFYDDGRMEIMAPASIHEKPKIVLHNLVEALGYELNIELTSFGSTTFRRELRTKGAEPDDSFYIEHASTMIGRDEPELETDPPPDLVIEIDRTSSSLNKFAIYAGLGVPEIWQAVKGKVQIWQLVGEDYKESQNSRAFPFLSAATLSDFLAKGLKEGEQKAARAFREWIRNHQPPPPQ